MILEKTAEELFKDAWVINCAFPRNTDGRTRAAGMEYLKELFLCCERSGAAAVINISSQSLYPADRTAPAKETDPVSLDSVYAAEKYAVELMAEGIFSSAGIACTNIRLASLIGPGFDARIVNRFVRQARENGVIRITDDRKQFGFLDVADAAEGLAAMLNSEPKDWRSCYNLGIRGGYMLREIAGAVKEVMKETEDLTVTVEAAKGDGADNSSLDAGAFYDAFGFAPGISLKESIRRIRLDR